MITWKINDKSVLTLTKGGQWIAETKEGPKKGFMSHGVFHPLFIILHDGAKFKEACRKNEPPIYKMRFSDTFKWGWVAMYKNRDTDSYGNETWTMKYKGRAWYVVPAKKKAWFMYGPGESVEGHDNLPPIDEDELIIKNGWSIVIKYDDDAHIRQQPI